MAEEKELQEEMAEELDATMESDEVTEEEVEEFLQEEEPEDLTTEIEVGEKTYDLNKKGRSQAEQISNLIRWLSKYGTDIAEEITNEDGDVSVPGNTQEIFSVLNGVVSADALIDLFVVVVGCSEKEADEHFDIIYLIDGVQALLMQERYIKVINRFFSTG